MLARRPRATRRTSFSAAAKQHLFSLLLCNALTGRDLVIRLMDILKQLQSFNHTKNLSSVPERRKRLVFYAANMQGAYTPNFLCQSEDVAQRELFGKSRYATWSK